jgi:hypothetical protein
MSLNEAQVRAVAVALQVLEERCALMRQLISNPAHEGALHQVVDDIPPAARGVLLHQITAIEALIAHLAAEFQLSASPHSARQMLVALLSSSWEHLEDTWPAKLRRYGPVDPVIAAPLDAKLARLSALISAMCAEARPESAAGGTLDVTD